MRITDLGRKVLLDRYALKDAARSTLQPNDLVIITIRGDGRTGYRREFASIVSLNGHKATVRMENGRELTLGKTEIDKPLELDYTETAYRVSSAVAGKEMTNGTDWNKEFVWLMGTNQDDIHDVPFIPGGRILAGAGTEHDLTLYNCYVLPSVPDSIDAIFDKLRDMAQIMRRGGGVGMCISSLRPEHARVVGSGSYSSGSVSWGGLFSHVTGLIVQGGTRIGALILILDIWHPDVLSFITAKKDFTKITNANISVGVNDAFMKAVDADDEWHFEFPDTTHPAYDTMWHGDLDAWKERGLPVVDYGHTKARAIWHVIAESAWESGEPGIWFRDRINKRSNSYYYNKLVSCNPCGEQPLPAWGVCNLGSLNLPSYVNRKGFIMYDKLRRAVRAAVRFLDNVVDVTGYFFDQNREQQQMERRIGLGRMGLGELLIRLGIRYGSERAVRVTNELFKMIACEAYKTSADLAVEKGMCPAYSDKLLDSGFMYGMPDEILNYIKGRGLRNITIMSEAPTGSIGTMVNTSTGIEPFFAFNMDHGSNLGSHQLSVDWINRLRDDKGKLPDHCVTAMDVKPEEHVAMLATCQIWTDSGVSKTINMQQDASAVSIMRAYEMAYRLHCNSVTVYRDKSRDSQVLNACPECLEDGVCEMKLPSNLDGGDGIASDA